MIPPVPLRMTIFPDPINSQTVTEVVKLPVAPENQQALLDYVRQWHETVFPSLPGFQQAALLKNSADAILIYGHWDSEEAIQKGSKDPRLAAYFQGLMPLLAGRPEIHICSVEAVFSARRSAPRLRSATLLGIQSQPEASRPSGPQTIASHPHTGEPASASRRPGNIPDSPSTITSPRFDSERPGVPTRIRPGQDNIRWRKTDSAIPPQNLDQTLIKTIEMRWREGVEDSTSIK